MKKKTLGGSLAVALLAAVVVSACSTPSSKPATGGPAANSPVVEKEPPKYPTKPIEYIIPLAAGGANDIISRATAEYLSKEWGQPINVINKLGAGGAVANQEVLKQAKKDGYTILSAGVSTASALFAGNTNLPFTLDDFQFVSKTTGDPLAYVVKGDGPWKDMKEFNEWVKKNPDQLTFASAGITGIQTFGAIQWMDSIGGDYSKAKLVVTNGAGDGLPKVAGGHITLGIQGVSEVVGLVKAGKLKILGIASPKRSPYFPDVPTMEEQGVNGITASLWVGAALPVGTPDYIVKKWEAGIAKMSKDPVFLDKLKTLNSESSYLNSAYFTKFVKDETQKYTELAIQKGLRN